MVLGFYEYLYETNQDLDLILDNEVYEHINIIEEKISRRDIAKVKNYDPESERNIRSINNEYKRSRAEKIKQKIDKVEKEIKKLEDDIVEEKSWVKRRLLKKKKSKKSEEAARLKNKLAKYQQ